MLDKIKGILAEQLDMDQEDIGDTASFKDDLHIDSLDLFEMITTLEEEYNFEIPAADFGRLNTVNDVVRYLTEKGITE